MGKGDDNDDNEDDDDKIFVFEKSIVKFRFSRACSKTSSEGLLTG